MYKAIKEIGGYKVGEEIPTEKAIVWLGMYTEPHVEEVGKDGSSKEAKPADESKDSESGGSILEDYLGRNESVVVKNIPKDKLDEDQLKELLTIEGKGKNRPNILKAIKARLSN